MADRYRGAMYVGVTADLAARVHQHRSGVGSDFCARYGLTRPVWADRVDAGPRLKAGVTKGGMSTIER